MAETWEIILWVIVAAAIIILIFIVITTIITCRRRNRRKKNVKHKRFEWDRKDETDYGKSKVHYNAASGQARILDQTDSGASSSRETKVEYNAKTEEAKILGVGDNKERYAEEKVTREDRSGISTDTPRVDKFSDYQMSSRESKSFSEETFQSKENEDAHLDRSRGDYVTLSSAPVHRERLQPIEVVDRQPAMTSHSTVNSYTNLGYSESSHRQNGNLAPNIAFHQPAAVVKANVHPAQNTNLAYREISGRQNRNLPPNIKFQQPAAVVKATVHPGQNTDLGYREISVRQNGSLPPNIKFQQPAAVIRAFVHPGQNTRRAETLPRNYSKLNYKKSFTTPRRRPALYTWSLKPDESGTQQPWILPITYKEAHPNRRRVARNSTRRSRSFSKRSLRKQKEKKYGSLNGVYITDSPARRSYEHNTKSSSRHEKSTRDYDDHFTRKSEKFEPYYKPSLPRESSDRQHYGDFYEERYKMVKKSEFPAYKSSSKYDEKKKREIEPDISSIVSGSEFSDFLPVPPRPNESQSDDSTEGYSRGSYKAYKSSLEKGGSNRKEMVSESQYDRTNHAKSFQETLESLRNSDINDQYSTQHEVTTTSEAASPWVNNESNFRKQHGVPISGVAVLPPEPVFIQMVDSDQSDNESQK